MKANPFPGGSRWRLLIVIVVIAAALWLIPPFLSDDSGLKFGWPYGILFSLIAMFGGLLFWLLSAPTMPPIRSTARAFGAVVIVFLVSIGAIVLLANLAPQFAFKASGAAATTAPEKGKGVFNDPNVGCFLCHAIGGSGGTRGPDLSHVATVASGRRPGMSAEDYVRESLLNPAAYVVSPYDNIMPPLVQRLSPEELDNVVAYLLSLK